MSKKIFLYIGLFFVIVVGGYFISSYYKDRVDSYIGGVHTPKEIDKFNKFLSIHDKKVIYIELHLSDEQNRDFNTSLHNSPTVKLFLDQKRLDKNSIYMFRFREDGKREFVYDLNTSLLKGLFVVNKIKDKSIYDLVSISLKDISSYSK